LTIQALVVIERTPATAETAPEEFDAMTVYVPALAAFGMIVNAGLVASGITLPFKYHWYDVGLPVTEAETIIGAEPFTTGPDGSGVAMDMVMPPVASSMAASCEMFGIPSPVIRS
jgi:hypothetical protein